MKTPLQICKECQIKNHRERRPTVPIIKVGLITSDEIEEVSPEESDDEIWETHYSSRWNRSCETDSSV